MFKIIKRLTLKVKIKLHSGINLSNYYQAALKDSSTSICLPGALREFESHHGFVSSNEVPGYLECLSGTAQTN